MLEVINTSTASFNNASFVLVEKQKREGCLASTSGERIEEEMSEEEEKEEEEEEEKEEEEEEGWLVVCEDNKRGVTDIHKRRRKDSKVDRKD